jgi:hypothetical protein
MEPTESTLVTMIEDQSGERDELIYEKLPVFTHTRNHSLTDKRATNELSKVQNERVGSFRPY